jgi:hypothetical protein
MIPDATCISSRINGSYNIVDDNESFAQVFSTIAMDPVVPIEYREEKRADGSWTRYLARLPPPAPPALPSPPAPPTLPERIGNWVTEVLAHAIGIFVAYKSAVIIGLILTALTGVAAFTLKH